MTPEFHNMLAQSLREKVQVLMTEYLQSLPEGKSCETLSYCNFRKVNHVGLLYGNLCTPLDQRFTRDIRTLGGFMFINHN